MNKKDELGTGIVFVLVLIMALLIIIVVDAINRNKVEYKYFKGEEIGISSKCYVDEEKGCMCLIDNNFISVNSYYEIGNE